MAEYIDRELLLNDLETSIVVSGRPNVVPSELRGVHKVIDRIKAAPTVDVQEIKLAQWIYEDVDWVCSNCGGDAFCKPGYCIQTPTKYCPNCGALMWDDINETH